MSTEPEEGSGFSSLDAVARLLAATKDERVRSLLSRLELIGITLTPQVGLMQGAYPLELRQRFDGILRTAEEEWQRDGARDSRLLGFLVKKLQGEIVNLENQFKRSKPSSCGTLEDNKPPAAVTAPPPVHMESGGAIHGQSLAEVPTRTDSASGHSIHPLAETTPISTPKPAEWQENEPKQNWCPENFTSHLNYVHDFNYQHIKTHEAHAFDGWRVIAATRRGKMHAHEGTHREDAFAVNVDDNLVIICVSDGAGAYEYSRIGSETTCREVSCRLRAFVREEKDRLSTLDANQLTEEVGTAMARAVYETCTFLHDLAAKAQCQPKDLRCTLLLVLLLTTAKATILLTSHVGDGFVAARHRSGNAVRYGTSDSGEFSGEVNCFVPDHGAPAKASSITPVNAQDVEALVICTDGIEDPFYPVEKGASQIFHQLYHGVDRNLEGFKSQEAQGPIIGQPEAARLLEKWLAFEKQGENDDRTIVVLCREPTRQAPQSPV